MLKNAIILAAGKSNRFAPFTYEKPKGLFVVKVEVLIERQIEQLIEAGVQEIIIVVGYMKEKFFYLQRKYPQVKLEVNNTYGKYGNIYSLYVVREHLKNTFICCADHYFLNNPFIDDNTKNISYRATVFYNRNFREFAIDYTDANVISGCYFGGSNKMAMVGHAYFNERFSAKFVELLNNEINDFGVANVFWEEFFGKHINELTLYMREYDADSILEFDSVEELRRFDSDFLFNVDSEIILNICNVLHCHPNDIVDISILQAGLTNVTFTFSINGKKYVYSHPGAIAHNSIDRKTEVYTQNKAKEYGLDNSLIYIDPTGWKISTFIEGIIRCDLVENRRHREQVVEALKKTHTMPISEDVKVFDNVVEANKLIKLACSSKGNLFKEFDELFSKVYEVDRLVKEEMKKYNISLVVSHHDAHEYNFMTTKTGEFYLIDWEYSGLNDPINDINSIVTRFNYGEVIRDELLRLFYGREPTKQEYRHAMAQSILNAFYWFSWGLFRGSVEEEDGWFFLLTYNYMLNYVDDVIESYKEM